VQRAMTLLWHYEADMYEKVEEKNLDVNRYNEKLTAFLTKLMRTRLSDTQTKEVASLFHGISEFKRIGDHAMSIARAVQSMEEKEVQFSDAGKKDLWCLNDLIGDIIDVTVQCFADNDVEKAREVIARFEQVEAVCAELRRKHLKRIKKGKCGVVPTQYFDTITVDLERIGVCCDYIAAGMIEQEQAF